MTADVRLSFVIRRASPDEFDTIGRLTVDAYAALPEMPAPEEQPEYYGLLLDVATRAANPAIRVLVAADDAGEVLGCVDFIDDVKHYGSGGTVSTIENAAGMRLLAVRPERRGLGIGRALTTFCLREARLLGRSRLVLHTTRAMDTAWKMYERFGFRRFPEIDFRQGELEVFGFSHDLGNMDRPSGIG